MSRDHLRRFSSLASRALQPERPAGDGVISRLGCRVGSDARLPHRHGLDVVGVSPRRSGHHSSPITFAWTLLFPDFSLRGGGERFLHDSVGYVSYCFALCPWTPPKRRDERTRVRRSDVTRARSERLQRRKRVGDRPRRTIATLRRCSPMFRPLRVRTCAADRTAVSA